MSLMGQGSSGTLTGIVSTEGAALPGVTVTVSSPALQGSRTAVTNENGAYNFPALPPGMYSVLFELEGMSSVTRQVQVTLAQTQRADASLGVSSLAEAITVTADAPSVIETTDISANFDSDFIEKLPVRRTILGAANLAPGVSDGIGEQITISGAPSYENLYLVNGAVVNDSIRGQPESVFIEDAIQETTVLTGSVSAEYGRFTGGVVSAITKSGGNEFSGSIRDNLENDDWVNKTPFAAEADHIDDISQVWEATLGGRIIRDRLWFFGAGRQREFSETRQTQGLNIPYAYGLEEDRYEGKLTGLITQKHSIVASYLDRNTVETNRGSFLFVDLASLSDRELPNSLKSLSYNGILSDKLLVELQYSEREFAFVGGGADARDRIFGTIVRDIATGRRGWSATFCGVCDDKERNNEYLVAKGSYFLSTSSLGTHNLVVGYEDFAELRKENNDQGGSGYRVFGEFINQGDQFFLRVTPGTSFIQNFPILNLSQTSNATTRSVFLNDKWDLNPNLTFNLGVRYDVNDAVDQSGAKTSDDSEISPRLGIIWDLAGNGKRRFFAGYNRYVAKLDNGINDESSNAGSPAYFGYTYQGPAINQGSGPYLTTDQVLTQVFAWFDSIGGNSAVADRGVTLPGVNTLIDGTLRSPSMDEFSVGYGTQIGSNAYLRADYINRDFSNFYTEATNLGNGIVLDSLGNRFDLTLVSNDDTGISRTYDAIQLQGNYRPFQRVTIGGNYTWSELRGNSETETANNATITLNGATHLPEYIRQSWNNPKRALPGDVEHRANIWLGFDIPTPIGNFNISALERFHTGVPFYASALINPNFSATTNPTGIRNPGYVRAPSTVEYYFMNEGEFRTDDVTATDLGLNFSLPIWRAEFFIQGDILNVFDEDAVEFADGQNGTNVQRRVFVNRTRASLAAFNPITETPVAGTHYQLDPNFGTPTNKDAYQDPRTYRVSLGLRF